MFFCSCFSVNSKNTFRRKIVNSSCLIRILGFLHIPLKRFNPECTTRPYSASNLQFVFPLEPTSLGGDDQRALIEGRTRVKSQPFFRYLVRVFLGFDRNERQLIVIKLNKIYPPCRSPCIRGWLSSLLSLTCPDVNTTLYVNTNCGTWVCLFLRFIAKSCTCLERYPRYPIVRWISRLIVVLCTPIQFAI